MNKTLETLEVVLKRIGEQLGEAHQTLLSGVKYTDQRYMNGYIAAIEAIAGVVGRMIDGERNESEEQ